MSKRNGIYKEIKLTYEREQRCRLFFNVLYKFLVTKLQINFIPNSEVAKKKSTSNDKSVALKEIQN